MQNDKCVMTLDAGGTNFVFSAIRNDEFVVGPITLPSCACDRDRCLGNIREGFERVKRQLDIEPSAISFAFPGPADYKHGVLGDLPNFPAFRGGVALGAFLEDAFQLPVYINNDGNLFAYGEAACGALPAVNARLESLGVTRRYHNLIGITLGTGFGCGIVVNGQLLLGDNGMASNAWCMPHKYHGDEIVEEGVSIRAVTNYYSRHADAEAQLTPKDICEIADGKRLGNQEAAKAAFAMMGEIAGNAIANIVTLLDGIVVIGGGLSGAAHHFMPALLQEMRRNVSSRGEKFPRLAVRVCNLDDETEALQFYKDESSRVSVPCSGREVEYNPAGKIGIMVSSIGANKAISLGAYHFALAEMNR